jgi:hypothetical protein
MRLPRGRTGLLKLWETHRYYFASARLARDTAPGAFSL